MTNMIPILSDFKSILDLDLYGEHMPQERITGPKIDLDLSAGSTYTRVYTVFKNMLPHLVGKHGKKPYLMLNAYDGMDIPQFGYVSIAMLHAYH